MLIFHLSGYCGADCLKTSVSSDCSTVYHKIVDNRVNFELFCDWLKVGHVVRLLVYDWIIPPPILSSMG
jgi:hypothetical protein